MKSENTRLLNYLVPLVASLLLGSVLALSLAGCQAAAPSYPSKNITYIVPSAQGSGSDLTTRKLVEIVAKYWPEAKIDLVNNAAGGGTGAAVEVMKANPDGYTMGQMMVMPLTTQPWLMGDQIPYKSPDDFTIVHQLFARSNVLVVKPDSKYNTVLDLFEDFKSGKRTEPFVYGGRGVGNAEHLTMEMMAKLAGLQGKGFFKLMPYAVDSEATAAVLGGHIEGHNFMWATAKAMVDEKRLKALVAAIEFPGMEKWGLKSAKQLGLNMEWSPRHYHIMPKGVPQEIVAKVDEKFKQAATSPEFADYLNKLGDFPAYLDPAAAKEYLTKTYQSDGVLVKELGLAK